VSKREGSTFFGRGCLFYHYIRGGASGTARPYSKIKLHECRLIVGGVLGKVREKPK